MKKLFSYNYTFCSEFDETRCPEYCFRAYITKELMQEAVQKSVILSWANFRGTPECFQIDPSKEDAE